MTINQNKMASVPSIIADGEPESKGNFSFIEHNLHGFGRHQASIKKQIEGARLRFRPVMMTSLAFILGLYPLVVAEGASQLARRDVGTPVFGGMILASFLGIFAIRRFMSSSSGSRRS